MILNYLLLSSATRTDAHGRVTFPEHLVGTTGAVVALLERVVPGSSAHFTLTLAPAAAGVPKSFTLADSASGLVSVTGSTASELTGGIGVYLREYCGMTFGWTRGGGTNAWLPTTWPKIGAAPVTRNRSVPYSHVTQVCTHSYTLVWHDWAQWERFIDWMALAGHNSIVAPTGQEEVQYKVLTEQFNLTDMEVRNWYNGPGFLTWSRGQNSHGNAIAGPLPRSFMKSQWTLQKQILARYREFAIAGHLPAFQGNAPWALAVRQHDTNNTNTSQGGATQGSGAATDTAWIDGRDPLFTRVADAWMLQIVADFGSTGVWQMDAFFGDGSGWGEVHAMDEAAEVAVAVSSRGERAARASPGSVDVAATGGAVNCAWSAPAANAYLKACATFPVAGERSTRAAAAAASAPLCPAFATLALAEAACASPQYAACHGVTFVQRRDLNHDRDLKRGAYELRSGATRLPSTKGEISYLITNFAACKGGPGPGPAPAPGPPLPPDPLWLARGRAAYGAIERADGPAARWAFQAWALHVPGSGLDPPGPKTLARLHGFSSAAPPGNFILMDMGRVGEGQWRDWKGTWGIPFIWTSLHVFGGNQGIKGELSEINQIPWEAPPFIPEAPGADPRTQAIGVGYTPEGLDQNPAYYELLQEAAFKSGAEPNTTAWLIKRAQRRYRLDIANVNITRAWSLVGKSGYANNGEVHDGTAVGLPPPGHAEYEPWNGFAQNVPRAALCDEWNAWGALLGAAPAVRAASPASAGLPETYTYDLVDIGREVLSQLTIPVSRAHYAALRAARLRAEELRATGARYVTLLNDLDSLLATDRAFLLGPWLASARRLGGNATDCTDTRCPALASGNCADFMEWNARAQLTTWYPTLKPDQTTPGQQGGKCLNYARKQWAGLIASYYAPRAAGVLEQALRNAAEGVAFDLSASLANEAKLSYKFQTNFTNVGPIEPVGDPVAVAETMRRRYASWFATC
jgi:hypothetical protein